MTKEEIQVIRDKAAALIRENPLAALVAAMAVGFIVAKMTSKSKVIYLEKTKS